MTRVAEAPAIAALDGAGRYRTAEAALWAHHGAPSPAEQWVEVAGRGIRVRVLVAGAGAPVLFIHGGPNAGSTWASVVARMPGRRALVLDRPGCGLSDTLRLEGLGLAAIAGAMVETHTAVIEQLADGPVDVVASSFGGACALWLAHARPDLIRRLVIEGAPAIRGMRAAMNIRMLAFGPVGRFIARQRTHRTMLRLTFRQIGHGNLVKRGWPSGPDLDWGLSMMNDTLTMRNEVDLIQRGATWRGFRRDFLFDPARLGEIRAPALWLWGEDEPFGSAALGRRWASTMPDATFELLPAAGHLPWLDDPPLHAERIEAFLAG